MTGHILLVGHVVEVTGLRVVGQLATSVDNLYRVHQSRRYAIGQVGSIVKIEAGDHLVFGLVTSLRMIEAPDAAEGHALSTDVKWIMMDLLGEGLRTGLGEGSFEFRRGVHLIPCRETKFTLPPLQSFNEFILSHRHLLSASATFPTRTAFLFT